MARFVSPPKSEFHLLRQPLENGERIVFDFFDTHLPEEWEIYIQPHLNGLRPDFVLLNPKVGIAVFEVKDWNFDAMSYRIVKNGQLIPKLLATKDGKTFSKQRENPIEQVYQYKQELFNLYCPRLQQGAGFSVITAGTIFPFADDSYVQNFFAPCLEFRGMSRYPQYNPISGRHALKNGDLFAIFPEAQRGYSSKMRPELYKDIRNWLIEPDFAETQRKSIELDKIQRSFVTSRTKSGYRRIRGAAGSGKSLVLAARAAELLGQNKQVLVVTFNITLLHYLMDIAVRWPQAGGKTRSDITWLNFHYWCKRVCIENGYTDEYDSLWKEGNPKKVLENLLPALVDKIIDLSGDDLASKYDAILVDEGQDFLPNWWSVLRKVCKLGGEMLLVADATQDIYDTASSWTDEAMIGAGFSGNWAELDVSYRLPKLALEKAASFAKRFLPQDMINLPKTNQLDIGLEHCDLRWVHVKNHNAEDICCSELLRLSTTASPETLSIADITFLCDSRKFGIKVVRKLGNKGIRVIHTYDPDEQESRRQKVGFYMGDARIKATTLHSFKGWESRALVLYVSSTLDQKNLALLYTGLTRLKRHPDGSCLTVVSHSIDLLEYGKSWPSFEQI
ncbi:TPA: NERD domain-containing protein [Photobacterium damselae]